MSNKVTHSVFHINCNTGIALHNEVSECIDAFIQLIYSKSDSLNKYAKRNSHDFTILQYSEGTLGWGS